MNKKYGPHNDYGLKPISNFASLRAAYPRAAVLLLSGTLITISAVQGFSSARFFPSLRRVYPRTRQKSDYPAWKNRQIQTRNGEV